jgi:hypothetical protein
VEALARRVKRVFSVLRLSEFDLALETMHDELYVHGVTDPPMVLMA